MALKMLQRSFNLIKFHYKSSIQLVFLTNLPHAFSGWKSPLENVQSKPCPPSSSQPPQCALVIFVSLLINTVAFSLSFYP